MAILRCIRHADAQRDPHAVWNAFVNLLAFSPYEELNDIQRAPHLVFWYESEVQNGGHLQFFLNRPSDLIEPTVAALRVLGGEIYVPILLDAARRRRSEQRQTPDTAETYVSAALRGEYADLDRAYADARPSVTQLLENYLNTKQSEFVLIEG